MNRITALALEAETWNQAIPVAVSILVPLSIHQCTQGRSTYFSLKFSICLGVKTPSVQGATKLKRIPVKHEAPQWVQD